MRLVLASTAVFLLSLALLVSPSGCGPGPSDESIAPSATASGPIGGHAEVAPIPTPPTVTPSTSSDSPAPFVPRPLVVPEALAKELASPDVQVRLKALDRWGQSAPTGAVDPLLVAMDDPDERVQARALVLLVQDWVRGAPRAEK